MSKAESPSEREARILWRVVTDVCDLYRKIQRAQRAGFFSEAQRDESWQNTAIRFPLFSERITALGEATKRAENTRIVDYFSPLLNTMIMLSFPGVSDEATEKILLDILLARCSTINCRIIDGVDPTEERNEMARALGVPEGAEGEAMAEVGLGKVVESVLKGELKLTRQIPA